MQECLHSSKEQNPYHLEDSVWTHTMMVLKVAELKNYNKIVLIAALLHDIGKVRVREVIEDKGIVKTRFIGHEGISYLDSISILNKMVLDNLIEFKDIQKILNIISWHGRIYSFIKDKKPRKPKEIVNMFKNIEDYNNYISLCDSDGNGRFGVKNGRVDINIKEIYNEEVFIEHFRTESLNYQNEIVLLIGAPGAGKTTFLENNYKDYVILSRDSLVEEMIITLNKKYTYNESFNDKEFQKEVDKELLKRFNELKRNKQNIVIDMTNLSIKSRRKWINQVNNYKKTAIMFNTDQVDLIHNNLQRKDKNLANLIIPMMKSFIAPGYNEFDEIIYVNG